MKREIGKKIKSLCDDIGTAAAAASCESITRDLETEYDKRVAAGMSELDAYRDVLKNVEEIKKTLESLPKSESEEESFTKAGTIKDLKKITGKISTCLWLLTVILYFGISFTFGHWGLTWLIFIWGSMNQTILDMILKYNKGTPLNKVMKSGVTSIMWRLMVILFFVIGSVGGVWHLSWLTFLVGALLQTVISWIFD